MKEFKFEELDDCRFINPRQNTPTSKRSESGG